MTCMAHVHSITHPRDSNTTRHVRVPDVGHVLEREVAAVVDANRAGARDHHRPAFQRRHDDECVAVVFRGVILVLQVVFVPGHSSDRELEAVVLDVPHRLDVKDRRRSILAPQSCGLAGRHYLLLLHFGDKSAKPTHVVSPCGVSMVHMATRQHPIENNAPVRLLLLGDPESQRHTRLVDKLALGLD